MLNKKSIGAALVCALALGASGAAFATPVNVDGVVFDPDSPLDLQIQALNFREASVDSVGDILTGYGVIGAINGNNDPASFCPGCDLTFTFQYTVRSITPGPNPQIVFDMGTVNFFVDDNAGFNVLDPNTAGVGDLWLSLEGHTAPRTGFTDTGGQLYASVNGTLANPQNGSFGFGLLDATGGELVMAGYADTNTVPDGIGGFADFSLNSSFQFDGANICANGICYPISGQGGVIGNSMIPVSVPEPAELGLLGLGLGALGFFIRRRRKELKE